MLGQTDGILEKTVFLTTHKLLLEKQKNNKHKLTNSLLRHSVHQQIREFEMSYMTLCTCINSLLQKVHIHMKHETLERDEKVVTQVQ